MYHRRNIGLLASATAAAAAVVAGRDMVLRAIGARSFANKFHELAARAAVTGGSRTVSRRRYDLHKGNGKREIRRRWLADAHEQQLNSHKFGALEPRHVFGWGFEP